MPAGFFAGLDAFLLQAYPGADADRLLAAMRDHGHRGAETVDSVDAAVERALELAEDGDLVVTLGAGDVTRASTALITALEGRGGAR